MSTLTLRSGSAALVASLLLLGGSGLLPVLVSPNEGLASHSQCSDGVDNDHNGELDYPEDHGCESLDDDYEGVSEAGMFVSVTDERDQVRAGSHVIYVIRLRQQRDDRRETDVELHLPAQVNFSSASEGGSVSNNVVRWSRVTVEKNITKVLTVDANLLPSIAENTMLVTRAKAHATHATDVTYVRGRTVTNPTQQFSVSITDGKKVAEPAEDLHYTVRVRNKLNTTNTTDVKVLLAEVVVSPSQVSGSPDINADRILWADQTFQPGEERVYTFTARTINRIHKYAQLHMRATAGSVSAVDDTVIQSGLLAKSLAVTITDNRETAKKGDIITYTVHVRNTSDRLAHETNVNASLPIYGEFVDADEGGRWDGRNVRWNLIDIAPRGERTLTYQVRVRSDAPLGHSLLATVEAQDDRDSDTTEVASTSSVARTSRGTGASSYDNGSLLFRKVADQYETMPGGRVRYTLYVRNILDHTIRDAVITDRFDPAQMRVVDAGGGTEIRSGLLQWRLPELEPGESWQTTYELEVTRVAGGRRINNVTTISGNDVSGVTLQNRVNVSSTGVISQMPKTGAPMDVLFVLLSAPLALGTMALQKKLLFL